MLMILYNVSGALDGAELEACDSWTLLLIGYRCYEYILICLQSIYLAIKNNSLATLYGQEVRISKKSISSNRHKYVNRPFTTSYQHFVSFYLDNGDISLLLQRPSTLVMRVTDRCCLTVAFNL
jgi:hypothetical protein